MRIQCPSYEATQSAATTTTSKDEDSSIDSEAACSCDGVTAAGGWISEGFSAIICLSLSPASCPFTSDLIRLCFRRCGVSRRCNPLSGRSTTSGLNPTLRRFSATWGYKFSTHVTYFMACYITPVKYINSFCIICQAFPA